MSKYGGWRGLVGEGVQLNAFTWSKDLHKVCGEENKAKRLDDCVEWKVGRSDRVSFWHDRWEGHDSLVHVYPRIFLNSNQKEKLLTNMCA